MSKITYVFDGYAMHPYRHEVEEQKKEFTIEEKIEQLKKDLEKEDYLIS